MNIAVLGGGRVGSAIARDLAAEDDFDVVVVDLDPTAVDSMTEFGAKGMVADLSDPGAISRAVKDADLVVGAVPGSLGFRTVARVLQERRPIVDISFFPEDPFALEKLALDAEVPCLVDCGVAPGLSNLLLGRIEEQLDETTSFRCFVGGLPFERTWPWEYKAPFSPSDVIEEYTRPARMRKDGREITRPALSDVELVDFPGLGTLEAFNTDGLRSLLRTSNTPDMVEKTMRYPGHAVRMRILREAGFFSERELRVASGTVRPRDVTEALLFSAWKFGEGEPDLTVMRIEIEGSYEGANLRHTFNLVDRYDPDTGTMSMARTTGYTCTAMANLVARGQWTEPGLAPPEVIGRNVECFGSVLKHLADRGVHIDHRVDEVS